MRLLKFTNKAHVSLLFLLLLWAGIFFPLHAQKDHLTAELLWKIGRVHSPDLSPNGKKLLYGVQRYDVAANEGKNILYIKDLKSGEEKELKVSGNPSSAVWTPDGEHIAFLLKGQLYEIKPDGTGLRQVFEAKPGISTFRYSKDMKRIAYTQDVKLEPTARDLYPKMDKAEVRIIDDLMYRHWNYWNDANYSHIFIALYEDGKLSGEAVDIMKGELYDVPTVPFGRTDDYVFSPDGNKLAYVCKKKKGKAFAVSTNTDIYLYDINAQKTTNLTQERKGYDTHPVFSKDGSRIAWLSMEREGYESDKNEIFLYDFEKEKAYKLTGHWDETVSSFIWGNNAKSIYFLAGVQATYQLFELNLHAKPEKDGEIRQITEGVHNYQSLLLNKHELIGLKQSMSAPNELYKVDIKSGEEQALIEVNREMWDSLKMGKVEKRMVKTSDDKEMLVWVIYPPDFDSSQKYPALLYCQGGPQSAVSQFFSYRWNFQLMAAHGYIIVAPNRRGLPTFGTKWNEAISGDWGGQAMEDYLAAIDALAKEPYIDKERLGAVGASYGGYSVYMLAGIHEGRFSAFVSHCGLFDMKSWYGTTEELFFANWDLGGPYWAEPKPDAYTKFNPSEYVNNWDTPIMVIHGGKDFRVPEGQGMQAFQAAQLRGIPSRFLYFPNEGHWVQKPQNGIIWHTEFFRWLDRWLK
jgi:dipeptidyl aminopeptidase/acylaminoacyl peptidase